MFLHQSWYFGVFIYILYSTIIAVDLLPVESIARGWGEVIWNDTVTFQWNVYSLILDKSASEHQQRICCCYCALALSVFAKGLDCHILVFSITQYHIFSLNKISEESFGWCTFFHVSLLFIFQGGFSVHLSGDLRIALAAVVGGIVNLLGMRRTLCSACKIRILMTMMITNVTKMTKV